jgi:uncharacterized repeat protein (TIGR01451 family)
MGQLCDDAARTSMRTQHVALIIAVSTVSAFARPVAAKPRLVISMAQTKEVMDSASGGRVTRMAPTQSAEPGEVVEYTLSYVNQGNDPAVDAVIEDPIPKGSTYVANSAVGDGSEITFSNDGGKTFAPAVKLTYEMRLPSGALEKRVATPAEYTHVRWKVKRVLPGATGKVAFRVKVS